MTGLRESFNFSGSRGSNGEAGRLPKTDEGLEEEAFPILEEGRLPRLSKRFLGLHQDIIGESFSASEEEELSEMFKTGVC